MSLKHIGFMMIFPALLAPSQGWSWGDLGHQTVAEIADRLVKPETKAKLEAILGPEPLAVGAIWPDAVRSDARFGEFSAYHFVEVNPKETAYEGKNVRGQGKRDGNTVLSRFREVLQSETGAFAKDEKDLATSAGQSAIRTQKAIAIRYIVHVIGDIHQPLHTGNGLDAGANGCDVLLHEEGNRYETTNLHSMWDEKLPEHLQQAEYPPYVAVESGDEIQAKRPWVGFSELADAIIRDAKTESGAVAFPGARAKYVRLPTIFANALKQTIRREGNQAFAREAASLRGPVDVSAWYADGVSIRKAQAYPDAEAAAQYAGEFPTSDIDENRPYCRVGRRNASMKVKLGKDWLDAKSKIVAQQILKGGVRLAAYLDEVMASAPAPSALEGTDKLLPGLKLYNQ